MSKQAQHCGSVSDIRRRDNAYILWAATETACDEALRVWRAAPRGESKAAYAAYCAALEREEAAARHLERLSMSVGRGVTAATVPSGGAG